MGKPIPDRWLDYKPIGDVIADSNFIAFKVPLHKRICENLPLPDRHTTCDVIKAIPQLGLVINLTNTQSDTKYYQPHDWQRLGVDYKWIKTEGHVTPSRQLLDYFCRTVQNFLMANPKKLVGVHCTHGLNRTGYFVCSYMVLCNNVSPSDAMRNFSVARGHQIERPNYINAIINHASVEPGPGIVKRQERHEPRADYRVHQDPIHVDLREQSRLRRVEREDPRYNWRRAQEPRDRLKIHEDSRPSPLMRQHATVRQDRRRDFRHRQEQRDVSHEGSRTNSINRQEPGQNRKIRRSRWENDSADDSWRTWVNAKMKN